MRVAFGPALPVGTAGEREYYDLVLTRFVPAAQACAALAAVTADDLAPLECAYVSGREKSLAAALTIADYDVTVEGGIPQEEIERSLRALAEGGTLEGRCVVRMTVRMGEQGSLRPEVFVAAALGRDVRTAVTRTDLFVEDEGVWRRPL